MASDLELFVCDRPEGGFEWTDDAVFMPKSNSHLTRADKSETRFLAPKPMDQPRHWRYNPLAEHPALYLEFASLAPTEQAYAAFASAYGELGVSVVVRSRGPLRSGREPFCRWRTAHARMRRVADVLAAIQQRDSTTLAQWFTIRKDGAWYEREDDLTWHQMDAVALPGQRREYLWEWAEEAATDNEVLLRIAQGWAQGEINKAMARNTSETSTARVIFDQDRHEMTLRLAPGSLLGAMWLQCARVLTLNPTFRSCKHCGRWFELAPDKRRKHAIYCSDRCKVAEYRRRKAVTSTTAP